MAGALDFDWVTPELAVGARFETADIGLLVDAGIGAVVDLRVELCDDERALRDRGIVFLHLPTQDQCAVSLPMLREGVAFVNAAIDRGERVLIHCEHGIGRSATLALCVLVARGMSAGAALELMKSKRMRISPSPEQYGAFSEWLAAEKYEPLPFETFAEIAYRHLRGA